VLPLLLTYPGDTLEESYGPSAEPESQADRGLQERNATNLNIPNPPDSVKTQYLHVHFLPRQTRCGLAWNYTVASPSLRKAVRTLSEKNANDTTL